MYFFFNYISLRALGTAVYVILKFIVLLEAVEKIKYYPVRKSLFYGAEIKVENGSWFYEGTAPLFLLAPGQKCPCVS